MDGIDNYISITCEWDCGGWDKNKHKPMSKTSALTLATKSDISKAVKIINKCLDDMKLSIDKALDDDDTMSEERRQQEGRHIKTLTLVQEQLVVVRNLYKELYDKKKKVATGNLGLRGPQFTTSNMIDFINTHANLQGNLRLKINSKGYGLFDRSTMTKFWSYYAKTNNLKDERKKGMYITDTNMNKLFGSVILDPVDEAHKGKTYYEVMVEYIKEMRLKPEHKPNNTNRAQFEPADSDGKVIKAFNNAALQVLVKPFFRNGYTPSNKEEHVTQLAEIKNQLYTPEVAQEKDKEKAKQEDTPTKPNGKGSKPSSKPAPAPEPKHPPTPPVSDDDASGGESDDDSGNDSD